jgi:NAD(P)-dependent dehydrogenase (short-subunit alcohol dehydrogenase family)
MFHAESTAEDVIREWGHLIEHKNILVTGASSGIGIECCRVFALAGAHVYMTGRDMIKTKAIADDIITKTGNTHIVCLELELSNIHSVRTCIQTFLSFGITLDILVNNAGCMALPIKTLTVNKFEMQMGTNHFGHFELTRGVSPCFIAGTRILNVSSSAHFRSSILFDDVNFDKTPYDPVKTLIVVCRMYRHYCKCL